MESSIAYQQAWIVVSAADRWQHQPLYLAIVEFLRRAGVADVTVFRDTADRVLPAATCATTLHEQTVDHPIVISFITPPERGAPIVTQLVPQFTALVEAGALTTAPAVELTIGRWENDLFPPQLTVAEVMRRGAVAVAPDTAMREIITLLIDQALRSVAVVDADEHIIGAHQCR